MKPLLPWGLAAAALLIACLSLGPVLNLSRPRTTVSISLTHKLAKEAISSSTDAKTSNLTGAPLETSDHRASAGRTGSQLWDVTLLARLKNASSGDNIQFKLPSGETASGKIQRLEHRAGEVTHVAGELATPESGRFFFQKQSRDGYAGEYVGVIEMPGSGIAYRIEPCGPDGAPELVERRLDQVLCTEYPRKQTATTTNQVWHLPPLNPADFPVLPTPEYQKGVPVLESLPAAKAVLYLDFQGGYTPTWGGVSYARPNLGKDQIREIWQRVSEDFLPFRINVTTDLRVFSRAPEGSRQRAI